MPKGFYADLEIGQEAEHKLADLFLYTKCVVEWDNNKDSGGDLIIRRKGKLHRIEVKNETNYANSGNISIERQQFSRNEPSGLGITTADIWIHVFGEDGPYVIYRVISMKKFLAENTKKYPIKPFGKSDRENKGHIVPIVEIDVAPWAARCETFDELYMSNVWEAA